MGEPDNHTAVKDRYGQVYVRADDLPGRHGSWWPVFVPEAPSRVGALRRWGDIPVGRSSWSAPPTRRGR